MALRVVGAGLARTGTTSLQQALQTLLGGACYHMSEVFPGPTTWRRGTRPPSSTPNAPTVIPHCTAN